MMIRAAEDSMEEHMGGDDGPENPAIGMLMEALKELDA
jgi:hypothetical protein